MKKIYKNVIMCKKCEHLIQSKHRHDFVTCPCGSVSVDGGTDYLRRVGNPDDWSEASVVEDENGKLEFVGMKCSKNH